MSEIEVSVLAGSGEASKQSLKLRADIFGVKPNATLIYDTVRWQRLNKRAGTHSTLTKGTMAGGNRKPWKQKGTGRARSGSNTSPVWVGGAVSHGPLPRDYSNRLPVRARAMALAGTVSDKIKRNKFLVLDSFSTLPEKTKDSRLWLSKIGLKPGRLGEGLVVLVSAEELEATCNKVRSLRNLSGITILPVSAANVADLINSARVLCTVSGVNELEARIARGTRSTAEKKSAKACTSCSCGE